eukprot:CAMPEP_0181359426 /NCGR_PEP_ID=MMETSP1106-20121128/6080_1 /TAXON_ID=81844 /ORGANISM="Mantoniella antarctica, Strain SL-175" /LENGTH=207 /DNA_ID=CAMNT_0023472539 /DNA_START=149 /DNA_END=772 /DNA_ORIENTATION=+
MLLFIALSLPPIVCLCCASSPHNCVSCCYVFYTAAVTLVSGSPSGRGIDTAQGIEETLPGDELVPFSFALLHGHPLADEPAFFVDQQRLEEVMDALHAHAASTALARAERIRTTDERARLEAKLDLQRRMYLTKSSLGSIGSRVVTALTNKGEATVKQLVADVKAVGPGISAVLHANPKMFVKMNKKCGREVWKLVQGPSGCAAAGV